jgi:hypothetical protein
MSRFISTSLPQPPKEYSQPYFSGMVRQLQNVINKIANPGPLTAATDNSSQVTISALTLINIPTSSTGLPSGSVWSDGGTLKIVP